MRYKCPECDRCFDSERAISNHTRLCNVDYGHPDDGENWKRFRDTRYYVSDTGKVWHGVLNRPQKLRIDTAGYYGARLTLGRNQTKNINVHQMVAEVFIGERPPGMQVNHKDGNKLNNHVNNLEYLTPGDNMRHSYTVGLQDGRLKLTVDDVKKIIEMYRAGMSHTEMAEPFKTTPANVQAIISGKTWKRVTKGYDYRKERYG